MKEYPLEKLGNILEEIRDHAEGALRFERGHELHCFQLKTPEITNKSPVPVVNCKPMHLSSKSVTTNGDSSIPLTSIAISDCTGKCQQNHIKYRRIDLRCGEWIKL